MIEKGENTEKKMSRKLKLLEKKSVAILFLFTFSMYSHIEIYIYYINRPYWRCWAPCHFSAFSFAYFWHEDNLLGDCSKTLERWQCRDQPHTPGAAGSEVRRQRDLDQERQALVHFTLPLRFYNLMCAWGAKKRVSAPWVSWVSPLHSSLSSHPPSQR